MVRFEIALVLMSAVTACSSGSTDGTPSQAAPATTQATTGLHDAAVIAKLREVSTQLASTAGVDAPPTMHAVAASDHQAAETVISGADINDHAPVYVVQMTGSSFTVPHHRSEVAAHVGVVLTVTFDAKTMRVTDVGYDDAPADLTRIDAEVVDLLAAP